MKNEILNYLSDFMNAWTFIDLTLITFFAWLAFFYRQTWKKQSFIDSHMVARNFTRINNQGTEIEILTSNNKELHKAFASSVDEMKKLMAENELLEFCNQENLECIAHWRERALHQKHTKKAVVEAKEWECNTSDYEPLFHSGNTYKNATSKSEYDKATTLCLLSENGIACLVEKQYFTPVKT